MKIIDNFFQKDLFENLKLNLFSNMIDWHFNPYINTIDSKDPYFQFIHFFYRDFNKTRTFDIIIPILEKLNNISSIKRIKANILTKTKQIDEHGYHTDFDEPGITTAIFYVNTCNGYTKFENGKIVESIENRLVMFKSTLAHTGTSCTDKEKRVVINFNYYANK